jgi:predicted GIY-YIG superfamily endonuclease
MSTASPQALVPVIKWLVYESTEDISAAIEREKQIKAWRRRKKVQLIDDMNPRWADLSDDWYQEQPDPSLPSE